MNKIINIQGLRGVAVLLVAFSHLFVIEQKYGGNSIIPDFVLFGVSGVDLFFVISGFVIVSITRGKFEKPMEALKFIYHRLVRIYPAYWFYSALVLIVFILRPSWVNSAQENRIDIVSSFLLLPQKLVPLVNVGWSLVHELYFYGIFFLLMLLIREKFLPLALAIWGSIVIFSNFFFIKPNDVYLGLALHPLTLEFIGGCFVAIVYYQGKLKHDCNTMLKVSAISFIMLIAGYEAAQFVSEFYASVWWWRVLTFGMPSVLIVYCLVQLEKDGYFFPKWLIVLGDASYSIYLSHVLVLSALGRIWHEFSSIGVMDNLIAIPILVTLMLYFGLISYNLIERPLIKFFRRMA